MAEDEREIEEQQAEEQAEPAAEPPVRDSGPVEGAPGEPGDSPAEGEAPEAEAPAEPELVAETEAPAEEPDTPEAEEPPAPADEPAAEAVVEAPAKKKRKRIPRPQRRERSKPKRERSAERTPIVRLPKPEIERGARQERRGVVVSGAMDKTIVVRVETLKSHPRYKKIIRRSTKFHAHDERNEAKVGDVVRIVETRPLSKSKRWRLVEILEVAK
jgi:small subunit ribosomal protein S17